MSKNTQQKHVRNIIVVEGKEMIERLTFYHSLIPEEGKLWKVIEQEFPLLQKEDIKLVKRITGSLDAVPKEPQPKPETFMQYKELIVYYGDRLESIAELIERIKERFPGVPFENLAMCLGIVNISITKK